MLASGPGIAKAAALPALAMEDIAASILVLLQVASIVLGYLQGFALLVT